jgi:hypothetical protein
MLHASQINRSKPLLVFLPIAVGLILAGARPAHANLLTNGSFESPGTGCVAGATSLPGWTVSAGNIDIINATCTGGMAAADGAYYVDLTGSGAERGANDVGKIDQSVSTQVGQQYRLSFYFGGNPQWQEFSYPNDSPIKSMNVLLNSSLIENYTVNTTGVAVTDPQWILETLFFTATSGTTQISFQSLNGANPTLPSDFGPQLDGVNLTAVPLPASAWLFLSALAGLGTMLRSKSTNRLGNPIPL